MKFEKARTRHPQLYYEAKIYRYFATSNNSINTTTQPNQIPIAGIPKMYWFGQEGENNTMVIELMGLSLEKLFAQCGRLFSLKTVLMLADQMIERLQYVHSRSFIHRDIKPDNFLMGLESNRETLYIIDFGLAKKYRDSKTRRHIGFRNDKKFTGTARYASLGAQDGLEQSRRDDMEAIGLILLYFLRGSLPWQGLKAETRKQKYAKILDKKKSIPISVLCDGLPPVFAQYLRYCRTLRFEDRPNYAWLRARFRALFEHMGFVDDGVFDWSDMLKNSNTDVQ